MAYQKNIVGNISHVGGNVRIGDELHIHLPEPTLPKELTLNIPRIHPDDIIGREEDLNNLHISLQAEKRVVVVNGLGGIGKTTLAQAYISRYYEEYHHIVWITQDSDELARDFVNATGLLRNLDIDPTLEGSRLLFEESIRKLKSIGAQPNLLVIDNGERSLRKYRDLLPGQPHWHLLVTSREKITGFHHQTLGFLDEPQALALFKKHYPLRIIGETGIRKLVRGVDYHTLAIEILAKMAAVQRYDLPTLQRAIDKDLKAGIEVPHNRHTNTIDRIGSYLRACFTLSQLSEEETWILQQFVCLPPEAHSYSLLRELLIDEHSPHAPSFASNLLNLADKGWLLYNSGTDSYSMHRIIAGVVRKERPLRLEEVQHLLTTLSTKLNVEFTLDNSLDKFGWVPYGKALLAVFPKSGTPGIARLQNRLGFVLLRLDDFDYARRILEKAVRSDTRNFGEDHPLTNMNYNNLALVLREQGDLAGARALLEKAARYDEKNLGPGHHHTAIRYGNLALVLRDQGELNRARTLYEKAIRIDEKNFGLAHPATGSSIFGLAMVMEELGDLRKTRSLLKKAVRLYEQYYGAGHPSIMGFYGRLGVLLREQGKYVEAKPLLEKALKASEKIFGLHHPETAAWYNHLGLLLMYKGEHGAAASYLGKAFQINENLLGDEHLETASNLFNLGLLHSQKKEYAAAQALFKKTIPVFEKEWGPDDHETISSYSDLADTYFETEDYVAARPLYEKVVRGCEKNFGKHDLETAQAYYDLGITLGFLDEYHRGAALLKKAIVIFRKKLPKRSSKLAWSIKWYKLMDERSRDQ